MDKNGIVFTECATYILSNFRMMRSGPFHGHKKTKMALKLCWNEIGMDLLRIRNEINKSGLSRDRYLLELAQSRRELLISELWILTKKLLPFTMGKTSFGLVGASKILFSVLPEIVLPVDNKQWLNVFRTVDLGDVLRIMVSDIQQWEKATGRKLNEMDTEHKLTTRPSIYNVMAMAARLKDNT